MPRYLYVSHGSPEGENTRTDFDAVASLALLQHTAMAKGFRYGRDFELDMIDYYSSGLDRLLQRRNTEILLADIPPDVLLKPESGGRDGLRQRLEKLRAQKVILHFLDHHPVTRETRAIFEEFHRNGLIRSLWICPFCPEEDRVLDHTRKLCATEVTARFLERVWNVPLDETARRIMRWAHDQDFGLREIPEANRISVVIGADYPPLKLADCLSRGIFWNRELAAVHSRQEEKTQRLLRELRYHWRRWRLASGRRIDVVYALMPPHHGLKVTAAGLHCLQNLHARVAVFLHRDPFLSIRINPRENELHAGEMLRPFGGGGHRGAGSAGAGPHRPFPYRNVTDENFPRVAQTVDEQLSRLARAESLPVTEGRARKRPA
ncbi:MAG: hypothetical protein D6679_07715 [Candidatus Hydrogenedentota bacterium]|nr:MAG: hypothetical protein D6679_07715 [Candidatus Hydrogenedentota bacterium]